MEPRNCIGFLGADWWGSDARAMAAEFRRQGHLLVERHYEDYLPTKWQSFGLKGIRRLALPLIRWQYNKAVAELLAVEALDYLLVFKGMLLEPATLKAFKSKELPCYLVYPDVSFTDHGRNIWDCLPLYDCVFTTKSYHLDDETLINRVNDLQFVSHGYDPEVHRPIDRSESLLATYGCDVSFVGCWSAKKEQLLLSIVDALPEIELDIWGPNWNLATSRLLGHWRGRGAYGDELAAIYSFSKINLGLLSEAGSGMQSGDQTTARSWQIPASGGLMLHEDNNEIREHFRAGKEIAVFKDALELVTKTRYLLENDVEREEIRMAGYNRCVSAPYTYGPAVTSILEHHQGRDFSGR